MGYCLPLRFRMVGFRMIRWLSNMIQGFSCCLMCTTITTWVHGLLDQTHFQINHFSDCTKMEYQEFVNRYTMLYKDWMSYNIQQVGSQILAEQLSKLGDDYPEFLERFENEL